MQDFPAMAYTYSRQSTSRTYVFITDVFSTESMMALAMSLDANLASIFEKAIPMAQFMSH